VIDLIEGAARPAKFELFSGGTTNHSCPMAPTSLYMKEAEPSGILALPGVPFTVLVYPVFGPQ